MSQGPYARHTRDIEAELASARAGGIPHVSIWDAIRAAGERHGSRMAILAVEEQISFAALAKRTQQVMATLRRHGVGPDAHVALLGTNTLEWAIAFFATVSLGATSVPLNTRLTTPEIKSALTAGDVTHLILRPRYRRFDHAATVASLRDSPAFAGLKIITIDGELDGCERLRPSVAGAVADAGPEPRATAVILFTSGSTSAPKGCMLTHQGIVRNACLHGDRLQIDADDSWFSPMPFFHAGGLVWGLATMLVQGSPVIAQDVFDASEAMTLIELTRPTYFHGIDTMFVRMMDHPEFHRKRFETVTKATTIGPPELLRRIHDVCDIPGIESKWGLSEGYGVLTLCGPDDPLERRLETVGRVFPCFEYRVIDPETGRDARRGEVGEVLVGGCAMEGYYKAPEATAAIVDNDGFVHTGDLGRFDGEYHYFWGRVKQMLKVGGENVAALEVESTIMGFADVDVAYVVRARHARLGEAAVAFVTARGDQRLDLQALEAHCRRKLSGFKVPRRFIQTTADELPYLGNGKISKPALQEFVDERLGTLS